MLDFFGINTYKTGMKKIILVAIITLIIIGCTGKSSVFNSSLYKDRNNDELVIVMPKFKISEDIYDCSNSSESNERLDEIFAKFDVPMTMTPRVVHYLNYYTGNGRPIMQRWLDRSNKYMYLVREEFQKEGLPADLIVLAFTESGYNPMAYSHAGAAGMWQFMKATGKTYGLDVTEWVDERRDFEKATYAATQHLKDLNKVFDDWYLSLAAYNAGQGRIRSATRSHKSNDFFQIASGATLKLETRDYVPKYLAQLIIYKNMSEYGFTAPAELPLLFKKIELDKPANLYVLADELGCSYHELKELNPELLTPMTPPGIKYSLRVPMEKYELAQAILDEGKDISRYTVYTAKSGEKISTIAKKHNVAPEAIKAINSFPYDTVYNKKVLFIPNSGVTNLSSIDKEFAKTVANLTPKYYTVKKGDNFSVISRKHNMPLGTLQKLNPSINPKRIYPGQVLIISQGK